MKCLAWVVVLTLVESSVGWGQDATEVEPPRVITVEAIGDAKGGGIVLSRMIVGDVQFQAMPFAPGGGGFNFIPEDEMGIANSEQFREELGLIPEQKEKLATLRKEVQQQRQKLYANFQLNDPAKAGTQMREMETQLRDDTKKRMNEILLPHQSDRLKQIRAQMQMRNRGLTALSGSEFADILQLTDAQKSELTEKQRKAEQELRAKIEELRSELFKGVVDDVLTTEQRAKLAKLTGADIKVKPVDPPQIRRAVEPPAK